MACLSPFPFSWDGRGHDSRVGVYLRGRQSWCLYVAPLGLGFEMITMLHLGLCVYMLSA